MQKNEDFVIQDGVLVAYMGSSRTVVIPSTVKRIGYRAFYEKSVSSVTIPDSVTEIDNSAFESCRPLRSVLFPPTLIKIGKWAFANCKKLESIELPPALSIISEGMFHSCTRLTSVKIPTSVWMIDKTAFYRCSHLPTVTLPIGLRRVCYRAFEGCVSLSSVTVEGPKLDVGENAFCGCASLRVFSFTGEVVAGSYAFSSCPLDRCAAAIRLSLDAERKVKEVLAWVAEEFVPTSKEKEVLTDYVKRNRKRFLKRITEEKSLDTFINICKVLPVPFSIDDLDAAVVALEGEVGLTAAILQYKKEHYSIARLDRHEEMLTEKAFGLRPLTAADFRKVFRLALVEGGYAVTGYKGTEQEVVIPERIGTKPIVAIGDRAFQGCDLSSITFPSELKSIGDFAFCRCSKLTELKLPSSLRSIGRGAFSGCDGISVLTIPDVVSEIGPWSFHKCGRLSSVIIRSRRLRIGEYVFDECVNLRFVAAYTSGVFFDAKAFPSGVLEIVGPADSPAESYAKQHNIPFTPIA